MDLRILDRISEKTASNLTITFTIQEQKVLNALLTELSKVDPDFIMNLNQETKLSIWASESQSLNLENWEQLFGQLPGFKECIRVDSHEDEDYSQMGAIYPTTIHRVKDKLCELILRGDGSSTFMFSSTKEIKLPRALRYFSGKWSEAFKLMAQTLREGWPQQEFPKKFESLLK